MPKADRPPAYRLYRARGCAVVTIDGKNHYLGPYGSPESHEKCARLIAKRSHRMPNEARAAADSDLAPSSVFVNELILRYLEHAAIYYRKNGKPTGELDNIRCAFGSPNEFEGDHAPAAAA